MQLSVMRQSLEYLPFVHCGENLGSCPAHLLQDLERDFFPKIQFCTEGGTAVMISMERKLQEKYQEQHNDLFMTLADMTKAFDIKV